jgi:hypothetical protein
MTSKLSRNDGRPSGTAGLSRRELIALGSACAFTPWLGRVAGAGELVAADVVANGAAPVTVGYLLGSDTLADLRAFPRLGSRPPSEGDGGVSEPWQVVPASTLDGADTNAIAATLTVLGLYPTDRQGRVDGLERAWLDILVPAADAAAVEPLRFHAWTYSAAQLSSGRTPIHFRVPVDPNLGLAMVLEAHWASRARRRVAASQVIGDPRPNAQAIANGPRVTLRSRPGADPAVPLQRGVYLLGIGAAPWNHRLALPAEPQPWRTDLVSVVIAVEPVGTGSAD